MIVTPLDSAILDSKEQYVFYHKMLDFVLKELIVNIQKQNLCSSQELVVFKQYTDLFLYSIEAMRIKYMYDEEDNMKIDLTDSGFPNYLEFRYLVNDLELKNEYVSKLENVEDLKEEFLDVLLRKKQHVKRRRLFQAASIVYYNSVNPKYIFNRFVQGKIIEAPENSPAELLTSWSFYDVSDNRPYVCFMYFNYEGKKNKSYKEDLYQVLKDTANRNMPLDTMAYNIDRKLPDIHPKYIKRIDLGPLHNVFAKDENLITHAILEGIGKKEIPLESYALSFRAEEVFSGNTFTEGGFFSKQTLQKWNAVERRKYVFAPHRIIQLLYNKASFVLNELAKEPIQTSDLKMKL